MIMNITYTCIKIFCFILIYKYSSYEMALLQNGFLVIYVFKIR